MHESRVGGNIRLERTGPEIFPITFPIDVIVTDEFRQRFEASDLRGAKFRPVIKYRIVELDWGAWDLTDAEAPEVPDSGEPEDYVLGRTHSPRAAAAMPELWELTAAEDSRADVYYLPGTRVIALSQRAKTWFESNYADYVTIEQAG